MADPAVMAEIAAARAAMAALPGAGLDLLFRAAHTHNGWQDRPVAPALLEEVVALARMAPTALNGQPLRITWVASGEAKARLAPCLSEGNRAKTIAAPVTGILWADAEFWKNLPKLAPHMADPMGSYVGAPEAALAAARLNGALQAGYVILAARALGLDCGPMGGFDAGALTAEFAQARPWLPLLLLNLGYGDAARVRPRAPRLEIAEMTETL
ncbi:MAG: malonic semialdehyde reductase [Gemmobacter sp.]|uniref:malonic semialdehyde reductase n=1 Tax=Gemmobacter sp. TaxID=1898957 RepID=UPI001A3FCA56|nr:malonic semialdehyde reductase [Gemmobacter sp.]MBL8562234.1 malonic semialdehyde reductase [Gemmobacter sp.]